MLFISQPAGLKAVLQMLSYCVARVILVAKIENWWLTLIQHLLIISAYYLWFALEMV